MIERELNLLLENLYGEGFDHHRHVEVGKPFAERVNRLDGAAAQDDREVPHLGVAAKLLDDSQANFAFVGCL